VRELSLPVSVCLHVYACVLNVLVFDVAFLRACGCCLYPILLTSSRYIYKWRKIVVVVVGVREVLRGLRSEAGTREDHDVCEPFFFHCH
jgi:hypothetical protein